MSTSRGNIISLFGVKGGIGKSILTLNLAGVISSLKKSVLIVDMDLYGGSIPIFLNKEVNKTIYNFADDYANNRYNDIESYIVKYNDYIDFIASPKDPRKASKIDSNYIDILLDKVKFNYDYVLVDTTHVLDEINLSILDKSDNILLIVSNDLFDIKNIKSLISIFKDLEIDKYKLILNNSYRIDKNYFSNYNIMSFIKNNIDYVISNKFYFKNIDKYIVDSIIPSLDSKNKNLNDIKVMETIIKDINGDKNE